MRSSPFFRGLFSLDLEPDSWITLPLEGRASGAWVHEDLSGARVGVSAPPIGFGICNTIRYPLPSCARLLRSQLHYPPLKGEGEKGPAVSRTSRVLSEQARSRGGWVSLELGEDSASAVPSAQGRRHSSLVRSIRSTGAICPAGAPSSSRPSCLKSLHRSDFTLRVGSKGDGSCGPPLQLTGRWMAPTPGPLGGPTSPPEGEVKRDHRVELARVPAALSSDPATSLPSRHWRAGFAGGEPPSHPPSSAP